MKKTIYTIIGLLLIVAVFFIQRYQNIEISDSNLIEASTNTTGISRADFLPKSNNQIIHHKTYSLSYNEQHEQAEWTVHVLNATDIQKNNFKRPYFEIDDMVSTGAASWRNYKNSGYDRGHLVPAGDRRGSKDAYEETFLTSNISPQEHEFNAGIWNKLEQKVRYLVKGNKEFVVVTGSILQDHLKSIGSEHVSVPEQFYKIIYDPAGSKMIAFLIPHKESNQPLYDFVVPVDSIEQITGIDFFYQLPDEIEDQLEKSLSNKGW